MLATLHGELVNELHSTRGIHAILTSRLTPISSSSLNCANLVDGSQWSRNALVTGC